MKRGLRNITLFVNIFIILNIFLLIVFVTSQNEAGNTTSIENVTVVDNTITTNQTTNEIIPNITINETVVNETLAINITLNETNITISNQSNLSIINETISNITNATFVNETIINETIKEPEERLNYIIEFHKDPLLKRFENQGLLEKEKKSKIQGMVVQDIEVKNYEQELKQEHSLALDDIESLLGKKEPPMIKAINTMLLLIKKIIKSFITTGKEILYRLTGAAIESNETAQPPELVQPTEPAPITEPVPQNQPIETPQTPELPPESTQTSEIFTKLEFYNVFNGIVLNLSESEAEKVKQSKFVKDVYFDEKVEITLRESVPLINADDVWKLDDNLGNCLTSGKSCLTGKGIVIAVIDTGVDYKHNDLGGCLGLSCKVIGGYDFINYDNDPMDDHYHGTHVASTAAGNGNLKGVAPDAKILAYKVLSQYGGGTWSGVIAGIDRAVDPNKDGNFSDHAHVISMSLGGGGNPDDAISRAVDNAVNAGVVAVIAAGNSGPSNKTILSPGTARKAITVGATNKYDALAYFSSRGPVVWSGGAINKPDITAPGVYIYAAFPNNGYSYLSGTSMATPHVSGAAALLLQQNPTLTPDKVKTLLTKSAVKLPYAENEVGSGRLDSLKTANNAVPCNTGETRSCSSNIGECKIGVESCINGEWAGICVGGVLPALEICDGKDNDCNNKTDDNLVAPKCDLYLGLCANNYKKCGGALGWLPCNISVYGSYYEIAEKSCWDTRDNDCDGSRDENSDSCSCKIDNAYWSKTTASEGDIVIFYAEGEKSCERLNIGIDIKETSLNNIIKRLVPIPYTYLYFIYYNETLSRLYSYWMVDIGNLTKEANFYFDVYPLANASSNISKYVNNVSSKDFNNGILKVSFFPDSDGDGVRDDKDLCPNTQSYLKYYIDAVGCPIPLSSSFDIIYWNNIYWGFLNWSNVSIHNFTKFEIGKKKYGKIVYPYSIDLRKKVGDNYERLDLDSYIKMEKHKIELNSKELPMFSQNASIIMYNVTLKDPIILKDGKVCAECVINYRDKSSGDIIFKVPHFTVYELVERSSIPETPVQQPSTSPGSGGSSGGGGGSSSGGGGGSGGGFIGRDDTDELDEEELKQVEEIYKWEKTFSEDDKELSNKKEIKKDLEENQRLIININDKTHYIGVIWFNESGVQIEIGGIVKIIEFVSFGEEKSFDVNNDDIHDFSISFEEIADGKTLLKVKPIAKIEKPKPTAKLKSFFKKVLEGLGSFFRRN